MSSSSGVVNVGDQDKVVEFHGVPVLLMVLQCFVLFLMIDQLIRDGRRIFGPGYNPFKSVISETRSKACSHAETETDNLYSLFMEKAREGKAMTGSADGGSRLRKTANETWRHGAEEECRKNQDPC